VLKAVSDKKVAVYILNGFNYSSFDPNIVLTNTAVIFGNNSKNIILMATLRS